MTKYLNFQYGVTYSSHAPWLLTSLLSYLLTYILTYLQVQHAQFTEQRKNKKNTHKHTPKPKTVKA